jgi:hypothetical protein
MNPVHTPHNPGAGIVITVRDGRLQSVHTSSEPTSSPIQWISSALCTVVKRSGREADQSPRLPSRVEVKYK